MFDDETDPNELLVTAYGPDERDRHNDPNEYTIRSYRTTRPAKVEETPL